MYVVFRYAVCRFCVLTDLQKSSEIRWANKTVCILRTYESFFSSSSSSFSFSSYSYSHRRTWLLTPSGLRAMTFSVVASRKQLFEGTKPINSTVAKIWFQTRQTIYLRVLTTITWRVNFFFIGFLKGRLTRKCCLSLTNVKHRKYAFSGIHFMMLALILINKKILK